MKTIASLDLSTGTSTQGENTSIELSHSAQKALLSSTLSAKSLHTLTFGAVDNLRDLLTGLHREYEIIIMYGNSCQTSIHTHVSLLSALKHFASSFLHLTKDTVLLSTTPDNASFTWLSRAYIYHDRAANNPIFTPTAPQVYLGIADQRLRIESCQQLAELAASAHTLYLTTSNLTLSIYLGEPHAN